MKLSKTSWLILGIGIFAIAFGSLYIVYRGQASQQEELDYNLSVAQPLPPKLSSQKEDLESQLTRLEGELTQLRSELTQAIIDLPPEKAIVLEFDNKRERALQANHILQTFRISRKVRQDINGYKVRTQSSNAENKLLLYVYKITNTTLIF